MKYNKKNLNILGQLINLGLSAHVLSVIFTYAVGKKKTDFIKKIKDLVDSFQESLSEDEKKELGEDIKKMMEQKADEFLEEMGKSASPEEIEEYLTQLKSANSPAAGS